MVFRHHHHSPLQYPLYLQRSVRRHLINHFKGWASLSTNGNVKRRPSHRAHIFLVEVVMPKNELVSSLEAWARTTEDAILIFLVTHVRLWIAVIVDIIYTNNLTCYNKFKYHWKYPVETGYAALCLQVIVELRLYPSHIPMHPGHRSSD